MSRSVLADGDDGEGPDAFTPPDPSSGDAIKSTVVVTSRRRTIGQGIALLAVGAGVWLVATSGDSSMIGGDLGSDDGLSTERAALARILDGVVAQVEVEAVDASGDQGAEFGAGAGPNGRPPAAPSLIGRDDPTPGGPDLGSGPVAPAGPSADDGELVPAASDGDNTIGGDDMIGGDETGAADPVSRSSTTRSATSGRPATTRPPTNTATTRSPTVTTRAVTTAATTPSTPSTTAPSTVTTGAVTTGAVTTGAVTTASTTATTAASTTQPESNCVVIVSKVTQYRADHRRSSPVIGQATPGTYDVLERHGAKWYRVAGGWLRDNKKVTPSGC